MEKNMTVLIVDDDIFIQKNISELLQMKNYNILTANDGKTALNIIRDHRPAVVLVDLILGKGLNGLAVIRDGKEISPLSEFILLTAYSSMESAIKGMELGIFNYVEKPYEVNRLMHCVKKAMEQCHLKIELEEKNSLLTNIYEHSTNLFYSHTPDHKLTYLSPQTRDYFDCEPEEAMVRWTKFVTDNPVNEEGMRITQKAIDTGKAQPPYELELIGVKGRKLWVEVHEAPVIENDRTVAVVGMLTDITERKKIEDNLRELVEENTLLAKTVENMSECVSITDDKHRFIFVNDAFLKTYGYDRKEIIGKESSMLLHDESASEKERQRYLSREGEWKGILWNVKKDGTKFPVELSVTPMINSEDANIKYIGIAADITERIKTQKRLDKKIAHLEHMNEHMIDRELKMVELKKEINDLCLKAGEALRYFNSNES